MSTSIINQEYVRNQISLYYKARYNNIHLLSIHCNVILSKRYYDNVSPISELYSVRVVYPIRETFRFNVCRLGCFSLNCLNI